MLPQALPHAHEDTPDNLATYEVEAGCQTYTVRAIDAYAAERKGRALFRAEFGFPATHVSARYMPRLMTRVGGELVITPLMVVAVIE